MIATALKLEPALATGLILVSCCPGGQASNVATYIANGNVALSVLMTTASTVGAIIMTPFLTKTLAGTLVPVDALAMAREIFQVRSLPRSLPTSALSVCGVTGAHTERADRQSAPSERDGHRGSAPAKPTV